MNTIYCAHEYNSTVYLHLFLRTYIVTRHTLYSTLYYNTCMKQCGGHVALQAGTQWRDIHSSLSLVSKSQLKLLNYCCTCVWLVSANMC